MATDKEFKDNLDYPMDSDEEIDSDPDQPGKEVKITDDGGVVKKIITPGSGWEKPNEGDEVSVHYVGTLQSDGSQFDSSRDRDSPFTFKLGQGQVIRGWDKGVATMKKGEKALLTCSPEYAYGAQGSPPSIPSNATLNFEVELLSWHKVNDISKERDNSLIKTVVEEGTGWDKPDERDEVLVRYTINLVNEKEPVAKSEENGVEFTLKDGLLCRAIPEAVKTMKKGEVAKLEVKSKYGFGASGGMDGKIPPDADLEIELKLLSWKHVEDVTDDKLVWKKTIKEGEGYKKPNEGAQVKAKYVCRVEGEQEILDEKDELVFVTDEEQVKPEIIEQIIMKMKKGEVAQAFVPPQHGYGTDSTTSSGKIIPDNANLLFEITLIEFENAKEQWEMENAEKVVISKELKIQGNALYKEAKWKRAAKKYDKAIKLIEYDTQFDQDEQKEAREVRKSVHLNLAACLLKEQDWKEVVKNCDKVLDKDSENVKALYRRAQAYLGTKDFVEAEIDIKRALVIEPDNQDLKNLHKRLKQMEKIQNKKDAQMYGNMFAKMAKMDKSQEKQQPATTGEGDVEMADAENADNSNTPEPVAAT
eukprot:TRINITY_DN5505_c0_g1_i1.p1 TRINITY_DN5505_c0_g1~~TRINITY_DN5505_c0_g1_i1.p1  ORF type:complete len:587 (-),score=135.63 TRINITY_DN5505_c0_g1_i1:292-2052(-)